MVLIIFTAPADASKLEQLQPVEKANEAFLAPAQQSPALSSLDREALPSYPLTLFPLVLKEGAINGLPYIETGSGVRFRYDKLPAERAGYFWFFEPLDVRGKTLKFFYSGLVPRKATLKIAQSGQGPFLTKEFDMESSDSPQVLLLKVPSRDAFAHVTLLQFIIEKSKAGSGHGAFRVERILVVDEGMRMPVFINQILNPKKTRVS